MVERAAVTAADEGAVAAPGRQCEPDAKCDGVEQPCSPVVRDQPGDLPRTDLALAGEVVAEPVAT